MGRVALIGDNSVEYVDKLIDIWNNGDCVVLINPQVPVKMCIQMMLEAGVVKCFVEQKYFERLKELDDGLFKLTSYESESQMVRLLPKEIRNKFRNNYSRDEAVVIYSSGTTGKSKGVILSHFAINTNADAIIGYMNLKENDCMYIAKSMTHSSTIVGELLVSLKSGINLVLSPTTVPPRFVFNKISQYGVTVICLNPTLLRIYALECMRKPYVISSLKRIYVSGSILDDRTYHIAHRVFEGIEIFNVYGLSEAGPRVTAQRVDSGKSNSVGKPIANTEIAIVGDDGSLISVGDRGIVHVHTPSLFLGYITGEEKHKSLYQGWLNTGDVGYMDENGELHIIGRVDDLIIIDAHKIYPDDIERVILENTEIAECIVVGYTNASTGVVLLGCVYVSENDLSVTDNKKLGEILMPYEIPKCYHRVEELPKNQNGKVFRSIAVQQFITNIIKE